MESGFIRLNDKILEKYKLEILLFTTQQVLKNWLPYRLLPHPKQGVVKLSPFVRVPFDHILWLHFIWGTPNLAKT